MRPTRIATVRLLNLLADGRAHSNAEIRDKTKQPNHVLQRARQRIRDHGSYLATTDDGWKQTTDPIEIERHVLGRLRNSYSEQVRLSRSMQDARLANPNDRYMCRLAAEQQAMTMQLGSRIGLTPMQIAADLTPAAGAAAP